ncbi:MAG: adenine nucleotide alpha hydrolase family protein [Candidatus Lokiarchaeota archaeon]|nr:adenine nucleotide alpha hydrolase family protein [Candidatus Lokiarchaeota archaeon]
MDLIKEKRCSLCDKGSVIYLRKHSGHSLCSECLINSTERIIYGTISKFQMLNPKDKIIVGFSGGKDSVALLFNLIKIQKRTYGSKPVIALSVDEGIESYNGVNMQIAKDFCIKYEIEHKIVSFKEIFGKTLDEIADKIKLKKNFRYQFDYCAILRRRLLNIEAKKLGGTVLALGFNLTNLAEIYLTNILFNRFDIIENQYFFQNNNAKSKYLRKIMPLMRIPEEEIQYYLESKKLDYYHSFYPYQEKYLILRKKVLDFIDILKFKSPEIEFNLFNGFLELSEIHDRKKKDFNMINCIKCDYPTRNPEICNYCEILEDLN